MHRNVLNHSGTTVSPRTSGGGAPLLAEREAGTTQSSDPMPAPSLSTRPGGDPQCAMPAVTGNVNADDNRTATTVTTTTAPVFRFEDGAPPSPSTKEAVSLKGAPDATPAARQSPHRSPTVVDSTLQTWQDQGRHLPSPLQRDKGKALCLASATGRADIVATLLAGQFDAGAVADASGDTPLMLAAAAGHVDVVDLLLQRDDVDPERRNAEGDTALVLAVDNNHPNVVASLVRGGVRISPSPFTDGMSFLAFAAGEGHLDIVRILLAQPQADVDAPCPAGGPLLMAASKNRLDVVAYLLEAGADCNRRRPDDGCTALMAASSAGHLGVVRLLVALDAIDLTQTDTSSPHTALSLAVIFGRNKVIDCLLAAEASRIQPVAAGCMGLQAALQLKQASVLEMFIRHGRLPQDGDLDFGNPDEIDYVTVIADLSADRRLSGLMLPADEQAASYFKQMFDVFDRCQETQPRMQWLRGQGMSMACARLVVAALCQGPENMRPQGASRRLLDLLCLSALRPSSAPDMERLVTQPYRAAGISAAAVQRLETRAMWQLNHFAGLANAALETTFDEMLDGVINVCVDKTGLDGQVRRPSLVARLCKNGFVKPLAEAIAASWCVGVTAVQAELLADLPSNPSVKAAISMAHAHIARRAPRPFGPELLRRLGGVEESPERQALFGGQVDEKLQALLAYQCEALRQKCLAPVEVQAPGNAPGPKQ